MTALRCHKVPHRTREEADRARKLMKIAGRAAGAVNVYKCPRCGFWHWGHIPKQNKWTKLKA